MAGLATTLRASRNQLVLDALDAGSSGALIEAYTAPQPATGGAVGSATLLGTMTCSDPAGTTTNGVLTLDTIADDVSADATGDIAWCRVTDSDGNFVIDLTAGVSGSGKDIIFTTLSVVAGGVIKMTSCVISEGNA